MSRFIPLQWTLKHWLSPPAAAVLLLVTGIAPLWAQSPENAPVLHRRSYQLDEELENNTQSSGRTILPIEASGEYQLSANETVDVELQPDRLSGFITRFGDRQSDQGVPLTFFFATSHLAGERMSFTTRKVHGVWFSFDGTIARGTARSRDQQGYYLLEGKLILHDAAGKNDQARMVSLPLARQYPNGR